MESDWTVTRLDGRDDVALVAIELHNPSPVDRQISVENRLDGPVLPPRRAGVPDPGWDEDGFTGVVPAGETQALGYATPAATKRPPITVSDHGRATGANVVSTTTKARRGLAESRPPVDAVPEVTPEETGAGTASADGSDEGEASGGDPLPPPVETWLTAVERRVERGERLTDGSVSTVLAELDALEADRSVAELETRLAADAAALDTLTARTESLAARARAVDVPIESLRRLA